MTLSLRFRVLLVIAAVNAALFTLAGIYMADRFGRTNDELERYLVEKLDVVGSSVWGVVDPRGSLNVAPILRWDAWSILDDAILIQNVIERRPGGDVVPKGIHLNPVGSAERSAVFDEQGVLTAIVRAMETRSPQPAEGGRALPILVGRGVWGGCWVRLRPPIDIQGMLQSMLSLFLLSTLLLTLGTFWVLRRLVHSPVEQLAWGARRVQSGDFSVRLSESARRDEVADLVRSFNSMTGFVQGFNRRLEEEVARATEMARRAEAAAMTQRRLAAMGELAAGIAHEINNPLGGLKNAVHTLEREEVPVEKRRRYLELLSRGLDRIGETVTRLRRFTPREAPRDRVALARVIRDAVELVRHRADRLGVRIETLLPPEPGPAVAGAANEIGQAMLNLLANALDALEEGGSADPRGPQIQVALEAEAGGWRIRVADNGPGVDADSLGHVSDLFYTTKEVGKGTGLGLSLVHNTVQAHHGRVDIRSEPGRSFVVELWFPGEREQRGPGEARASP